MKLSFTAIAVIVGLAVGSFPYELFAGHNWLRIVDQVFFQAVAVLVFAWVIRNQVRKVPSEKEMNRLFRKFDEFDIRAGVCTGCGKEMIIEIPAGTPIETVVEVVTNFCRIADLSFSRKEGDLLHFKIG